MDFDSFSVRNNLAEISIAPTNETNATICGCMWNLVFQNVFPDINPRNNLLRELFEYMHWPVDDAPSDYWHQVEKLKAILIDRMGIWHQQYDLFEQILFGFHHAVSPARQPERYRKSLSDHANSELRRAGCPYRFVNFRLVLITSAEEIAEIESALRLPEKFAGAKSHVQASTDALAEKPDSNIRSSVKESIAAVESALKVTVGDKKSDMSKLTSEFGKAQDVHPAILKAIKNLYGYSSDQEGLRHAMVTEDKTDVPDARMMLIVSSALVNWIAAKDAELST